MTSHAVLSDIQILLLGSPIDKGKRDRDRQHTQRMTAKGYTLPVIADLLGLSETEVATLLSEEVAE